MHPPFPLSLPQPCGTLSNTQRTNATAAIAPAVRAVVLIPTHHTLGSTLYLPLSDPSIVSPIQDICTPSRSLISTPWPQYQDSWEARIQAQSRSGCNPPPRPPPTSCFVKLEIGTLPAAPANTTDYTFLSFTHPLHRIPSYLEARA